MGLFSGTDLIYCQHMNLLFASLVLLYWTAEENEMFSCSVYVPIKEGPHGRCPENKDQD